MDSLKNKLKEAVQLNIPRYVEWGMEYIATLPEVNIEWEHISRSLHGYESCKASVWSQATSF